MQGYTYKHISSSTVSNGKRWGKLSAHQEEWLNQPSLYIPCHIMQLERKLYHLEICYILSKKSKI